MIERYIYSSVLIFGSVEVGSDIEMTFHQKMIEITSYDTLNANTKEIVTLQTVYNLI